MTLVFLLVVVAMEEVVAETEVAVVTEEEAVVVMEADNYIKYIVIKTRHYGAREEIRNATLEYIIDYLRNR